MSKTARGPLSFGITSLASRRRPFDDFAATGIGQQALNRILGIG
jgi:hypothetical protein